VVKRAQSTPQQTPERRLRPCIAPARRLERSSRSANGRGRHGNARSKATGS
jgi:hypothetical protein